MSKFVLLLMIGVLLGCDENRSWEREEREEGRRIDKYKELVLKKVGKAPSDDHLHSYEQIFKIKDTNLEFNYEMKWDFDGRCPSQDNKVVYVYKTESVEADFVYYSLERPQKKDDGMYALTDIFKGEQILVVPYVRISLVRVEPQSLGEVSAKLKSDWDAFVEQRTKWRKDAMALPGISIDKESILNRLEGVSGRRYDY